MSMKEGKNTQRDFRIRNNEEFSREEIDSVIRELKRKAEKEFQESLKEITPEERDAAIEWKNDMD